MKPFETTLPAAPVQVLKAELTKAFDRYQLRLTLALRGAIQNETLQGECLAELVGLLTARIGFDGVDAIEIIKRAEQPHVN